MSKYPCTQDTKADNRKALKDVQKSVSRLATPSHEDHGKAWRSMTTRDKDADAGNSK